MRVTISKGNTKIGGVPNVSLTPGVSCRENAPCFTDGCYAKKALMYPAAREAWANNLEFAEADLTGYMDGISSYLATTKSKLFRWHVAGDILSQKYYEEMVFIAQVYPGMSFLCFTKRYDILFLNKPANLHIVLSTWPAMTLPKDKDLPWAWLEGDVRIPRDQHYFRCPGNCGDCGHICWEKLDKDIHCAFPKH